jgi:hypothetical protein
MKAFRPEVLGIVPKALKVYHKALDLVLGEDEPQSTEPEKIEVLDGNDLKRRLDHAYKRGLSAGMDALKAATETLKGSQVFTQRQDVAVEEKKPVHLLTAEELEAEVLKAIESRNKRLALKSTI